MQHQSGDTDYIAVRFLPVDSGTVAKRDISGRGTLRKLREIDVQVIRMLEQIARGNTLVI